MTLGDMVHVLHAKVLVGEEKLDTPALTACCSDLMSDVLAFVNEKKMPGVCPGQGAHGRYFGRRGGPGPGGYDHKGDGVHRLRPAV